MFTVVRAKQTRMTRVSRFHNESIAALEAIAQGLRAVDSVMNEDAY